MSFVSGESSEQAWRRGAEMLLNSPGTRVPVLVTQISDPSIELGRWFNQYNPSAVVPGKPNFRTIAAMLAPKVLLSELDREAKYTRATNSLARLRKRGLRFSGWRDTYFERLSNFPKSGENQLERIVTKLRSWPQNHHAALYAHIESPSTTRFRTRGGPCLQYVQVGCINRAIDVTAVYRSHDFFEKALGNFIGLTRLARFFACEGDKELGTVRCISLNAHAPIKRNLHHLIQI